MKILYFLFLLFALVVVSADVVSFEAQNCEHPVGLVPRISFSVQLDGVSTVDEMIIRMLMFNFYTIFRVDENAKWKYICEDAGLIHRNETSTQNFGTKAETLTKWANDFTERKEIKLEVYITGEE